MPSVYSHYNESKNTMMFTVADPEGFRGCSFEGLRSKILRSNVLRTLRSHWSYALNLNSIVITHVCQLTLILLEARGNHRDNEQSERAN